MFNRYRCGFLFFAGYLFFKALKRAPPFVLIQKETKKSRQRDASARPAGS
jgi:hypothetical protein